MSGNNLNDIIDEALIGFIEADDQPPVENVESEIGAIYLLEKETQSENSECVDKTQYQLEIRISCLIAWFVRASSATKTRWLDSMLEHLQDKSYLDHIVYVSNYNLDKLQVYSQCQPSTPVIYDKCLNDHDRSLEKTCLEETFKSDLSWYASLKSEQQVQIIMELLALCSGCLVKRFFECAKKERLKEKKRVACKSLLYQNELMDVTVDSNTTLAIGVEIPANDNSELALEIRQKAKMLNDAFSKYQHKLYGTRQKSKGNDTRRESIASGASKTHRGSQDTKKSGSNQTTRSKSSGGKDGKQKSKSPVIDQIQMLPVWIVKKIFNYLDQDTLKKIRSVNIYWAFVVDDLLQERTCRKSINSMIKSMEEKLKCLNLKNAFEPPKTGDGITNLQKRMIKLADRGAVTPKLRTVSVSKTKNHPLTEKVAQECMHQSLTEQGSHEVLESFPRNIPTNSQLLATPNEVLGDLGKRVLKPVKKDCGGACVNMPKKNSNDSQTSIR
ncbi:hypothetical protein Trydic_g19466 [Trypoxylus dichotomus]